MESKILTEKKKLKGKKVILLDNKLDKIITSGNLFFIGKNELLASTPDSIWNIQVTIERTPHTIDRWEQVIEWSEDAMIKHQKLR